MKQRLQLRTQFPESARLMAELDNLVRLGLDPLQLEMIKIRASQINGCAYCMNKHIADALKLGEDPHRLYVLSGWREARNWFSGQTKRSLR